MGQRLPKREIPLRHSLCLLPQLRQRFLLFGRCHPFTGIPGQPFQYIQATACAFWLTSISFSKVSMALPESISSAASLMPSASDGAFSLI